MKFNPHEYQRKAIEWVLLHPFCGLFMEMGLGKSICTLTAIQSLIEDLQVGRVLVVAPKKVAEATWSDEVAKWDHLDLLISVMLGTPAQRMAALNDDADLYVTSRDLVPWLDSIPVTKRPRFDMIVIDELTSFKSSGSKRFKAMKRLRKEARRIVGLTGTPAPNGMLDLWAQMYCIDGGERLGPFVTRYRDTYFTSIMHNNIPIKVTPKAGAVETITSRISDICFTMKAGDYLDLPQMMTHDIPVSMGYKEYEGYQRFERDRVALFKAENDKKAVTAQSAAALVNKLAQYSNGCIYAEDGSECELHTAKIETLFELIEKASSPVLCFYAYQHDCRRIMSSAPKGMKVRKYEGPEELRDWNAGKIDLLLAHPASTAYGLNMQQGGNIIVWFSTGWNLELYLQANARLHRQGQQRPVQVYRLICKGTVDEKMAAALNVKDSNQESVVKRLAMDVAKEVGNG